MPSVKSVAVVGLGPAGAITIDALVRENKFDKIEVFERREKPGGCWIPDPPGSLQELPDVAKLALRASDETLPIPSNLPRWDWRPRQYRFSETSIYPDLETNICATAMEFSQEPIPDTLHPENIKRHGVDTPFRHHTVIDQYIEGLVHRHSYDSLVTYNTTVELMEKIFENGAPKWELTLRRADPNSMTHNLLSPKDQKPALDYWYTQRFDAVVVASGHYIVPWIPHMDGLAEFAAAYPGSVEHSKSYRGPDKYRGKRVLTVGSSISGPDIAFALALAVEDTPQTIFSSIHADRYHPYFGDYAFQHPSIKRYGPISHICSSGGERTVHFEDGSSLRDIDHIIFGTGYAWTLPFLPKMEIRNNRVPGLYLHIFPRDEAEDGLVFVGAVAAGFTFKVFEWQAVLAARFLASRVSLPPISEQQRWEQDRIAEKGDGVAFTALYPYFEEYFEQIRALVGSASGEGGRPLPVFDKDWRRQFDAAHLTRIDRWKRENERARRKLKQKGMSNDTQTQSLC